MCRSQQITAILTAVAIATSPLALMPCACAAALGACCWQLEPAEKPSCCCDAGCESATGCRCDSPAAASESGLCTCALASDDIPAIVPTDSVQVVDVDGSWFAAAYLPRVDAGLRGSASGNLFDQEALGGPPGLRLHALLCVWRN